MEWSANYIQELDGFVYKTRGLLDYKKVNFSDSIKAILEHNRRDILVAEWRGRPPLRVVLTKDNKYFTR